MADYLTGVAVPAEREIRPDMKERFPRTAVAIRAEYEKCPTFHHVKSEYNFPTLEATRHRTDDFKKGISMIKDKRLPAGSPMTVGFASQVKTCAIRQYQILWGDKPTFFIKQISTIVQALIAGSLFYNAPDSTAGLFSKSGACFFALLFNSLLALSEVTESFSGRPVLIKHKSFAFFHPAAFCLAQIAADVPVILFQVSTFSIILYFMVGLTTSAAVFFTFWIIVVATTFVSTKILSITYNQTDLGVTNSA